MHACARTAEARKKPRRLSSALPAGYAFLECRSVHCVGLTFGNRLVRRGHRVIIPAGRAKDGGFGREISERRLDLDRLIDVLGPVIVLSPTYTLAA
jgi:hypothetical protein